MNTLDPTPRQGWQARLELGFTRIGSRTLLSERRHSGPLLVQRPFYPEADGACHVYVLHPPGGVVGGDELELSVDARAGADALLTTPAAAKFYRSVGARARQQHLFRVAEDAALEWLPQETIVYDGARMRTVTRVELHGSARFIGWEILCLGRPAAGEEFAHGACRQALELWHGHIPLYLERGHYEGDGELLRAAWGLRCLPVTATLLCSGSPTEGVEAVRGAVNAEAGEWFGASQLEGVLVCRYLGPSAARARALFMNAWSVLRPILLGKSACPPRVWMT
ncbi:MAG: urease accessory protein UreD [Gammaproteobacteria bacterium]